MNFIKKGLILCSIMFLSSCSLFGESTPDLVELNTLSQVNSEKLNYYRLSKQAKAPKLNSLGKQKILIIPVEIKGFEKNANSTNLECIKKVFTGTTAETGYESVASYYEKSSYNKLNLYESTVADSWFSPGLTPKQIYERNNGGKEGNNDGGTWYILEKAIEWYKATYTSVDITQFDNDKDGYLDGVWLIYSSPNIHNYRYADIPSSTNPFWAFTYSDLNTLGHPNIKSPVPVLYAWASYDFMFSKQYPNNAVDAHTYIHETGHMLGLDDYYDTTNKSMPLGAIDMMDFNVGDHNAFSKFALGWISPYIVDTSVAVKLPSLVETGSALLIKAGTYNNTPFDEYFMVQYITPTGLNYQDYIKGYHKGLYVYNRPGVMITHVDSRAGYLSNGYIYYTSDISKMQYVALSNTTTDKKRLLTIMPAHSSKNDIFTSNYQPSNSALFQENETFSLESNSNYRKYMESGSSTLNKGSKFAFKIKIGKLDQSGATIIVQ